jgi:hypothetical protein
MVPLLTPLFKQFKNPKNMGGKSILKGVPIFAEEFPYGKRKTVSHLAEEKPHLRLEGIFPKLEGIRILSPLQILSFQQGFYKISGLLTRDFFLFCSL